MNLIEKLIERVFFTEGSCLPPCVFLIILIICIFSYFPYGFFVACGISLLILPFIKNRRLQREKEHMQYEEERRQHEIEIEKDRRERAKKQAREEYQNG
ncbi:MAG: hypothetical protein ABIG91_02540 [Patescibacteria group bacterium]